MLKETLEGTVTEENQREESEGGSGRGVGGRESVVEENDAAGLCR